MGGKRLSGWNYVRIWGAPPAAHAFLTVPAFHVFVHPARGSTRCALLCLRAKLLLFGDTQVRKQVRVDGWFVCLFL